MPKNLVAREVEELEQVRVNMDQSSSFEQDYILASETQEALKLSNLLFAHLLTIASKGKEPLVNYNQSHVVTLDEYMKIIRRHAIEKEIAKK